MHEQNSEWQLEKVCPSFVYGLPTTTVAFHCSIYIYAAMGGSHKLVNKNKISAVRTCMYHNVRQRSAVLHTYIIYSLIRMCVYLFVYSGRWSNGITVAATRASNFKKNDLIRSDVIFPLIFSNLVYHGKSEIVTGTDWCGLHHVNEHNNCFSLK